MNPFKDGADWLVVNLAGGGVEVEAEVSGDVLMGGRIGRVAAVGVETAGNDDDGPKGRVPGFFSSCTDAVDDSASNDRPGENAGALGLRAVAGSFCAEAGTLDTGGVAPVPKLVSCTLPGIPDGALCEAEKVGDDDSTTTPAGASDADIVDLANGDSKADAAVLWSPASDTTGADVEAPNGGKKGPGFVCSPSTKGPAVILEAPGAEVVPKAEAEDPKTEEEPPNAEPDTKVWFPKTFGVVLRFANADAAGGTTELGADGSAGKEDLKAEAGGVPKTEVDELDPEGASITEGEGRTPKLFVSHSVALGFSGLG